MSSFAESLDCLQQQLAEIEALEATFPDTGAVSFSRLEQHSIDFAKQVCEGSISEGGACSPADVPELSGTLSLPGRSLAGGPLQLRFQFPKAYPGQAALQLNVWTVAPRSQADALQQAVQAAAEENQGLSCLLLAVDALQSAAEALRDASGEADTEPSSKAEQQPQRGTRAQQQKQPLKRVLIWFHHIKNPGKRRAIVEWAHQLQLGGHSKPGFPGVVIAEGEAPDVDDYVQRLRGLRWQAMSVRGEEVEDLEECAGARAGSTNSNGGNRSNGGSLHPRRRFRERFSEVPDEDMSRLAALCRAAGLEQLFLTALKLGPQGAQ